MQGYVLTNLALLSCLLWSLVQPGNPEPVSLGFAVNLLNLVYDFVLVAIAGSESSSVDSSSTVFMFSIIITVINALFRIFSTFLLYRDWLDRA